jgi:hypothetical protein
MKKGDTEQRGIAADANRNALSTQRAMAKKIADGLTARSKTDPDFLRNHVRNTISPETTYQHFRLHTRPDDKGNATHHLSDMQDDASKLDDFDHFRVVPHDGQTISYRIEGRRRGSTVYESVLDQGIKKGSGPMKGFAGMTKAPFLTKKDKGKELVSPDKVKKVKAAKPKMKTAPVMAAPVAREPTPQEDAMTNEGGREPNKRDSGGVHGGRIFNDKV